MSFKVFLFVSSDVLWKAPNRPRSEVIWLIASSTMLAALVGSAVQVGDATRAQFEQLAVDATQLGGVHARDADAGLLVADHVGAELEQGAAAGDGEVRRAV